MKYPRTGSTPQVRRDVYARLTQRLEKSLERERRANEADGNSIEDEKLTHARLALFGSAPK